MVYCPSDCAIFAFERENREILKGGVRFEFGCGRVEKMNENFKRVEFKSVHSWKWDSKKLIKFGFFK